MTISWGAIGGVGYVANNQAVTDHLKRVGFELLPYQQALSVLGDVLQRDATQITVGAVDWQQWSNFNNAGVLPRFSQLITTELNQMQQDQHTPFLQQLAQTPVEGRRLFLQEHLRGQFAKVLGISKPEQIELQHPVFDLGLDSLMGVELQNRLEKSFERSLPQSLLFNHSTVTALVDHLVTDVLASVIEFGTGSGLEVKKDRSQVASTIAKDHKHNGLSPIAQLDLNREVVLDPAIRFDLTTLRESREPASIFLTGATGFLGAFLLDELLRQTTAQIYCLVRATNPQNGGQRIRDNLADYALWDDAFADRIVPVLGDLDLPRLGLSSEDYDHLAGQIDVIYHNGAWVNFLAPYTTLKKTNVSGTQEILRFAGQGHVKPLHFISSYSVFFSRERTQTDQVRETDDLSPAETLCDNGYVRSKWVAEKMVTIARERGLPVAIYRPGVLFGDSRTGISNPNDFINCMILGCMQMESVPTENALMDLCPVDFAGQAIIHLSRQPQSIGQAFHLVNPNPLSWPEWVAWINGLGYPLQAVSYNNWKARLQTTLDDVAARNALYPFAAALPSAKGDTANFSLSQVFLEGRAPRFDCQQTLDGLTGSGITYPAVNANLLQRYFAYFVEKGALHPTPTDPIASR